MKTEITKELLFNNGFEEREFDPLIIDMYNKELGIDDYCELRFKTDDSDPLHVSMSYKWTNNGANWHMHIDNSRHESIGSADLSYVEHFNMMMEIFGSDFRL